MAKKTLPSTIEYTDLLHDEFSATELKTPRVDENYRYIRDASLWGKIKRFFLFFCIAKPMGKIYLKTKFHHEIVGRWKLKRYRHNAIILYGNHTQDIGDAIIPAFFANRYINTIVHPNNLVSPVVGKHVPLLGGIPLPNSPKAKPNFDAALERKIKKQQAIIIYPEAHIWPYCTFIRPFPSDSFTYPLYYGSPVFCFVNTYHRTKKEGKVRIRTYIDGPFFPNPKLSAKEAREELRNEVYNQMCERAALSDIQVIQYVKKGEKK